MRESGAYFMLHDSIVKETFLKQEIRRREVTDKTLSNTCTARLKLQRYSAETNPGLWFLVLEQRADAGDIRHGKRIAMSQASVYGHLVASHHRGRYAGSLISIQAEDALLTLRELR